MKKMTIMLFLTSALTSFNCLAKDSKGPICWLKFNEGKGLVIKDSSKNDNNGVIMKKGKYTKWVIGKNGYALEFTPNKDQTKRNDNGCVKIANMGKYDFSKGLTLMAWIKLSDNYKNNLFYEIISNTISTRGPGFRFTLSWGQLMFKSGKGGVSGKTWGGYSSKSMHPFQPNTWYHIAGVYDGSTFKVYIDGEEVGSSASNLTITKGTDSLYIGSYTGGYAYGFSGIIDEVKIYNYPRKTLEILNDANNWQSME
jgi:hypothetical protein